MIFWLIASALTLAACLAVLLPFLRPNGRTTQRAEHDLEVYKDQLAEVERDAARGLIGPTEAEQARAEIGRRILALDGFSVAGVRPATRGRLARMAAAAGVLSVPLVSWGIYAAVGSPAVPDQPLSARLEQSPANSTAEELVARAEQHLRGNPDDVRGWEVLAPIYLRSGRFGDAATAYRNTIRLDGATAPREAGLGEAIARAAGGEVTAEAQASFQRALAIDARDGRSMFFLALALQQEERTAESTAALERMVAELRPNDPWREVATDALSRLGKPQAGPSERDVAAAPELSGEERGQMVEGMVKSLDERLRAQPDDIEGWQRLVRSYVVLGRQADATDALLRGLAQFEGRPEAVRLTTFAAGLGIAAGETR